MSLISTLNDNPAFMLKSGSGARKNMDFIMGKTSGNSLNHSYKKFNQVSYK